MSAVHVETCPWCRPVNQNLHPVNSRTRKDFIAIRCMGCGCMGPEAATEALAIKAWNERPQSSPPSQPQEETPFHPDTCPTHPMTRRICPLCQPQEAGAGLHESEADEDGDWRERLAPDADKDGSDQDPPSLDEAKAESGERSDPEIKDFERASDQDLEAHLKSIEAPSQAVPIADLEKLLEFISHKRGEIMDLCANPGRLEEVIKSLSEYVVKSKGEPQAHAGGREPGNLDGSRKPLPGASRQEEEE